MGTAAIGIENINLHIAADHPTSSRRCRVYARSCPVIDDNVIINLIVAWNPPNSGGTVAMSPRDCQTAAAIRRRDERCRYSLAAAAAGSLRTLVVT